MARRHDYPKNIFDFKKPVNIFFLMGIFIRVYFRDFTKRILHTVQWVMGRDEYRINPDPEIPGFGQILQTIPKSRV